MITLEHLPPPPAAGLVTSAENDGRLRVNKATDVIATAKHLLGEQYIDVVVGQEPVRTAHSKQEARDAFYAHTETAWQRVMSAYYEEGWTAGLHELVASQGGGGIPKLLSTVAAVLLKTLKGLAQARNLMLTPNNKPDHLTAPALRNGSGSVVSVWWHPHTPTLAAVFCDDTIRVFSPHHSITPLLKDRRQRGVTDVSWMPYSASLLAVACESGVLLWTLDPVNVVTRPSGSCVQLLSHPSTTPCTSLAWHPKGTLLATVGGLHNEVVIWDVGLEVATVVHSGMGGPVTLLRWSPDVARLFASYQGKSMRVFESNEWTYEPWKLESPVQSAVWSSSGQILLFVTQDDPVLYCIGFTPGTGVGGTQIAGNVADLSLIELVSEDGEPNRVGGAVQQLAWDPRSERLAVVFRDTEFIALFHTHINPELHLAAGGFIRGEPGQVAVSVAFQQGITNGAILSVVWSNGQVQHIPMHYSVRTSNQVLNQSALNASVLNASIIHTSVFNNSDHPNFNLASPNTTLTGLFTSP